MVSLKDKLTKPKVVKLSIIASLIVFIPSFLIAILIAFLFGGTRIDPGEFNLFDNWISDLGSIRYTPIPFLFDFAAIITSFLVIPIFLYFKKDFEAAPLRKREIEPRFLKICQNLGLFFLFIGDTGLFGIGLFSEDRAFHPYSLHEVFSVVVWGGFAVAAMFMGVVIINKKTLFSKIVGYFMIFGPLPVTITYVYLYLSGNPLNYFFEWLMLFCIFAWLVPFCLKLARDLKTEIKK